MSLHRTEKGAEMAMEFHKSEQLKEFEETYPNGESRFGIKFGTHEDWFTGKIEIQD